MATVAVTRKRRRFSLWIVPLVLLLIATAFALPPLVNINRFQRRITDSISRGIGRPVRISSVKMHLLPRPGFEIEDFVVEEDPAFGAEPILRCAQVTAYVRLLSLWRGRLEIARIGFDEPSLNLVRNREGRWNFEALLSRAAKVPNAPTAQRYPGGLPRFPYIDADSARINFKFGDEKMPFSFLNADLAVWLANPDEWRVQFAAQPVRTDLNLDLANTGLVRLKGSLRRAPMMNRMPLDLHAEWVNAPLGQLSRIMTGSDADWRGELDATAEITGSAEHASLKVVTRGRGIHRVEFEPRVPLNLEIRCEGQYTRAGHSLDALTCLAPTGEGHLLLTGSVHGTPTGIDPALSLEVNHTPVASAFDGLRLVRSGFAPSVEATGTIDGNFTYARTGQTNQKQTNKGRDHQAQATQAQLHGQATVSGLTIAAPAFDKPLILPALHFAMNAATPARPGRHGRPQPQPLPEGPTLLLEPFAIGQPGASPSSLMLNAAFAPSGFSVHAGGQARLDEFVALGREFGLLRNRSVAFAPQGTADLDLTVHGPWLVPVTDPDHAAPPAALDGSLRLRNAQITGDFLAQPVQIAAAQAVFANNRIDWTASSMTYGPLHAEGSLSYPAFCQSAPECKRHFTLRLAALDAATAQNALLGATRHGELLQGLLDRLGQKQRSWPALSGTVQVGALTIDALSIRDLNANLNVEDNTVQIESLTGRTLDAALNLTGRIEMPGGTPRYAIEARLDHAAAPMAAALFQEKWGPGSIRLTTTLSFSGYELQQLVSSAVGSFHWEWSNGALPRDTHEKPIESGSAQTGTSESADAPEGEAGPAGCHALTHHVLNQFDSWAAEGTIAKSKLVLQKSRIVSGTTVTPITGTIGFDRELDLAVPGNPDPLKITGTLQDSNSSPPNP